MINAYQLAIVITLLPMAALGERVGYRRVYQVGLVVFTAGSLGLRSVAQPAAAESLRASVRGSERRRS